MSPEEKQKHIEDWNKTTLEDWDKMVKHTNGKYKRDFKLAKDNWGRFYVKPKESIFSKLSFKLFGDGKILVWLMYLPFILFFATFVAIIIVVAHFW